MQSGRSRVFLIGLLVKTGAPHKLHETLSLPLPRVVDMLKRVPTPVVEECLGSEDQES